jgi:hypothetical protein
MNYVELLATVNPSTLSPGEYDTLLQPVTVAVSGDTAQPQLQAIPAVTTLEIGDSDSITFSIVGLQPATPIVDKDINIYFEILGANGQLLEDSSLISEVSGVTNYLAGGVFETRIVGQDYNNSSSNGGGNSVSVTLNTADVTGNSLSIKMIAYNGTTYETLPVGIGTAAPYTPSGGQNGVEPMLEGVSPVTITLLPKNATVEEGYISGATVFVDVSGNGILQPGDPSTTTNSNGTFSLTALSGSTGPLVAIGGFDTSTGLPLTGELSAPAGSTVITPLTTIITALGALGVSGSQAQTDVLAALGLSASYALTSTDPIAAMQGGDAPSASVFVQDGEVFDTIQMITASLSGLGSTTAWQDTVTVLANMIANAAGQAIDLTNTATLTTLIDAATQSEQLNVSGIVSDLAAVISASNSALESVLQTDLQNGSFSTNLLSDASAVELVAGGGDFR